MSRICSRSWKCHQYVVHNWTTMHYSIYSLDHPQTSCYWFTSHCESVVRLLSTCSFRFVRATNTILAYEYDAMCILVICMKPSLCCPRNVLNREICEVFTFIVHGESTWEYFVRRTMLHNVFRLFNSIIFPRRLFISPGNNLQIQIVH